jgi:hypothetical protein
MACLESMAHSVDGAQPLNCPTIEAAAGPISFLTVPTGDADSTSSYTYPTTLQRFEYIETADSVEFIASGQLMGVGFISGPRSGWVQLSIDDQPVRRFRCFDRHSHYERYILLPAFFALRRSRLRLACAGEPVDFSIAGKEHPDFALSRTMKLVHLAGQQLRLEG